MISNKDMLEDLITDELFKDIDHLNE